MIGSTMKIFIVLNILIIMGMISRSEFLDTRDAEIDRLLKKLNKPAIKSIKSPDGDIIDCVHMKNHPIYDHPLFKNHIIQMRPNFIPGGWNTVSTNINKKLSVATQLWTINGRCPKNSIPIRRTRKIDILKAKSIERYGKKDPNCSIFQSAPTNPTDEKHEYAQIKVNGTFHGVQSVITIWKPYVQTPREFSLAQIWLAAHSPEIEPNTIEAGWQVYPNYYRDDKPRFFVYWTADGYVTTGCYNLDCPGFVLINQEFALGAAFSQVSTIDGDQHMIPLTIWKDPRSKHWWIKTDTQIIGYWPSSLFNYLQNGTTEIQWGGEILDYKDGSQHTTTKMGSGRFAQEGYKKASYFRNIEIIDENQIQKSPEGTYPSMTQGSCYNVQHGNHPRWGVFFFYGGPGRNPNCR